MGPDGYGKTARGRIEQDHAKQAALPVPRALGRDGGVLPGAAAETC